MPSRRPRLFALLALLVAGPLALPSAQADPYVGVYRGMDFSLTVDGADGASYFLDVTATEQAAGPLGVEQFLYLDIRRCAAHRCANVLHARKPLQPSEISISPDLTAGRLATTVSGVGLSVSASGAYVDVASKSVAHPGFEFYPLESLSGGPNVRSDVYQPTDAAIHFGGRSCAATSVDLFTFESVDQKGTAARDGAWGGPTLPAGLRTRPRGCF